MLVVFGAGGHGKVVADLLLAGGEHVDGFIDDGVTAGTRILELPVLGGLDHLRAAPCRVALGVGDNAARERIADTIAGYGCTLVTGVHPRAVISRSSTLAEGVVVMAGAVINPSARIERGAIINTGVIVEHDCQVGAFAHLSPNATLGGNCRVEAGAHLGIGATMLPGTTVGARAVVGGGALVSRDIAADLVAVGVPARARRSVQRG